MYPRAMAVLPALVVAMPALSLLVAETECPVAGAPDLERSHWLEDLGL